MLTIAVYAVTETFAPSFTYDASVGKYALQVIGYGLVKTTTGEQSVLPAEEGNCAYLGAAATTPCLWWPAYTTITTTTSPTTTVQGGLSALTATSLPTTVTAFTTPTINALRFQILACTTSAIYGDICTPSNTSTFIGKCPTSAAASDTAFTVANGMYFPVQTDGTVPFGTATTVTSGVYTTGTSPSVSSNAVSGTATAGVFNCYVSGKASS